MLKYNSSAYKLNVLIWRQLTILVKELKDNKQYAMWWNINHTIDAFKYKFIFKEKHPTFSPFNNFYR